MAINKIDELLLNEIYQSEKGLLALSLFNKYTIPMPKFLEFVQRYKLKGIILLDRENRIILTSKGKDYWEKTLTARHSIYNASTRKDISPIGINEPYIPDKKFVDDWKGMHKD